MSFRVTWQIDSDAPNARAAAVEAFHAMRRHGTTATVFIVTGETLNGTVDCVTVDLAELEESEEDICELAAQAAGWIRVDGEILKAATYHEALDIIAADKDRVSYTTWMECCHEEGIELTRPTA